MDIDKLDKLADKYQNTYRTMKMKPGNLKSGKYIDHGIEHNNKDPKFTVGDHTRISKYKNIFRKG